MSDEDHFYNVALDLFKQFDVDASGSIDKIELAKFMIAIAEQFNLDPPTNEEVENTL